jgi:hypothetical protein
MPRASSLPTAAVLVAAATLCAANARSEEPGPPAARLEWRREAGAESCIDADTLANAVNQRWKRRVFASDGAPDIVVRGSVLRTSQSAWAARIELTRASGESLGTRELVTTAADCSALDDSVALAVGLMLDVSRQRLQDEQRLAPPPEAGAERPAAPTPVAPGAPTGGEPPRIAIPPQTLAPRAPFRFEASAAAELGIGVLPVLGLGARAELAMDAPRFWRIAFGATFWGNRETSGLVRGARFSYWSMDLAICPLRTESDSVALHLCAAQRVGHLEAQGFGLTNPASTTTLLYALGIRGAAAWRLDPLLAIVASGELDVPFDQYRFAYRDVTGGPVVVYRTSALTAEATLGLSIRW